MIVKRFSLNDTSRVTRTDVTGAAPLHDLATQNDEQSRTTDISQNSNHSDNVTTAVPTSHMENGVLPSTAVLSDNHEHHHLELGDNDDDHIDDNVHAQHNNESSTIISTKSTSSSTTSTLAFPDDVSTPIHLPTAPPDLSRSGRERKPVNYYGKTDIRDYLFGVTTIITSKDGKSEPSKHINVQVESNDPNTYKQSQKSKNAAEWMAAMQSEIESIEGQNVWVKVPRPLFPTKVIKGRWVFKTKLNEQGMPAKFKARYVVKGFEQIAGIDF